MKDFKPKITENGQRKTTVFVGLCKGCGLCLVKCPQAAIMLSDKDLGIYSNPTIEIDLEKCTSCGLCELYCPESAVKIEKKV